MNDFIAMDIKRDLGVISRSLERIADSLQKLAGCPMPPTPQEVAQQMLDTPIQIKPPWLDSKTAI